MSDHELKESLSALMDGELAPAEAERVLEAVLADPELTATWQRYHAVRAALQGERDARAGALASRIRDALEREPVAIAVLPPPRTAARVKVWHAVAMAASVAVVAVLVTLSASRDTSLPVQQARSGGDTGSGGGTTGTAPATPRPTVVAVAPDSGADDSRRLTRMTWNDARPGVEKRLNGYLLTHSEYLSQGVQGLLPYARVVGYDGRD